MKGGGKEEEEETCPTCGQSMSEEARVSREKELESELVFLAEEGNKIAKLNDTVQIKIDAGLRARTMADHIKQLDERVSEFKREAAAQDVSILSYKRDIEAFEKELQIKQTDKEEAEKAISSVESQKEVEINAAQQNFNTLTEQEQDLRRKVEEFRRLEATVSSSQSQANVTIALLEDRINSAKQGLAVKSAPLLELEAAVAAADRDKEDIIARSAVMERLGEVLGPRGIQHYVFMGVIRLLEQIANAYLDVLACGGIQLTLQGEEDSDKIVKTVSVRAADGEFKERSLSQLSGGQWRRVSMALDFAFAEVVRRRGTLRSNLIVMDEVLTHLDASGREAVGTVLRAMVEGPRSDDDGDANASEKALDLELSRSLLGGGAYDTVIVILQDLSAQELEESFDHIDTVVKQGDSSVVIIDGEDK
jgi:DNA repair exonuclease SbcCD ATPase subunit